MKIFSRSRAKTPPYLLPLRKSVLVDPKIASQLWACVSLSRSQYYTHYGTAIGRFGLYFQSEERLNTALCIAIDQLQPSLICRLPRHRDREESVRFEQVWKFTCFLKPLLSEAMSIDRRWFNKRQQETASFIGAVYYRDYTGLAHRSSIKMNLLNFVHPISADWLLQDKLRCIDSLYCIIDSAGDTLSAPKAVPFPVEHSNKSPAIIDTTAAVKLSDNKPSSTSSAFSLTTDDALDYKKATSSSPTNNQLQPEISADLFSRFTDWLSDESVLLKDDNSYIESPLTIEQFIADNDLNVSVGEVQQSLLSHGFTRQLILFEP